MSGLRVESKQVGVHFPFFFPDFFILFSIFNIITQSNLFNIGWVELD